MTLRLERIPEIPPQWRMEKKNPLNYFTSYHPTKKLSRDISFEKQNSFSHIHGSVCIDTKRIVSDGCRAQMAVSHDGVESLQHVAGGGAVSFICGRSWFLPTEDKAHWLKTLQLWAKCQQEWGWKWNQQLLPGGFHSADEHGVLEWPALRQGPKQLHTFVALMAIDSSVQYFLSRHLSVFTSLKSALGNLKPTSNWTNSERWGRICSVFFHSALPLLICSTIWCLCRGPTPQFLKGEAN